MLHILDTIEKLTEATKGIDRTDVFYTVISMLIDAWSDTHDTDTAAAVDFINAMIDAVNEQQARKTA